MLRKEEGENTKKIRRTLKAHISGTAWRIQLKFGIGGPPPPKGIHTENFVCFVSEMGATPLYLAIILARANTYSRASATLRLSGTVYA